jgi:hypothetical protein
VLQLQGFTGIVMIVLGLVFVVAQIRIFAVYAELVKIREILERLEKKK